MSPPTLWQSTRQILGRAVRETGQALDRAALTLGGWAVAQHEFYDDPVVWQDFTLSRHRPMLPLLSAGRPVVSPHVAYVAPCATLIGSVRVQAGASVWYGAVLRADACENAGSFGKSNDEILELAARQEEWELEETRFDDRVDRHGGGVYIGENTNIQDGSIVTARRDHCKIGKGVTVGHLAQIHSATVEDFCLIGMGSLIGEGALVETESLVAAGAVVPAGQVIRSGELWVGNPARKLRDLTAEERQKLHYQSDEYVKVATEQRGVMQLGGNLSDSVLEELAALPEGDSSSSLSSSPSVEKEEDDEASADVRGNEERAKQQQ